MKDYIEREAAEKALDEACRYYPTSFYNGISASAAVIHILPAADVKPLVRGEWMRGNAYPHHVYCSNCYCTYIPNDRWQIWVDKCGDGGVPRDYCPNCGAEMVTNCRQLEEGEG